jgi:hypothetical protein
MSWQKDKELELRRIARKQQELDRVRMLHDLFFKKPISTPRIVSNTASKLV